MNALDQQRKRRKPKAEKTEAVPRKDDYDLWMMPTKRIREIAYHAEQIIKLLPKGYLFQRAEPDEESE